MTYPYPNGTNTFAGITLSDFSIQNSTGYVLATIYFRNDLYVQTNASQTNDIEICAGVKHTAHRDSGRCFHGARQQPQPSTMAPHWWAVLGRVPNCNKVPDLQQGRDPRSRALRLGNCLEPLRRRLQLPHGETDRPVRLGPHVQGLRADR